ncbi:MAG: hypothetical protein QOF09_2800 [Alphaproteobacteria bacterium]|nr:hypothetical protein [Alphaproteobacteria bacterium]
MPQPAGEGNQLLASPSPRLGGERVGVRGALKARNPNSPLTRLARAARSAPSPSEMRGKNAQLRRHSPPWYGFCLTKNGHWQGLQE